MTAADKPVFLQALARLAVALREKEPDVVMLRVYFEGMQAHEVEFNILCVLSQANVGGMPSATKSPMAGSEKHITRAPPKG